MDALACYDSDSGSRGDDVSAEGEREAKIPKSSGMDDVGSSRNYFRYSKIHLTIQTTTIATRLAMHHAALASYASRIQEACSMEIKVRYA